MKKIVRGLTVLALVFTMLIPSNISYARQQDTYRLNKVLTRAEFAAILNRELELTELAEVPFSDVKPAEWYSKDLSIAKQAGYLRGVDNRVSPEGKLTRQDAALMLARAYKLVLVDTASTTYSDDYTIGKGAKKAVETLRNMKVLSSGSVFTGKDPITYGEAIDYVIKLEDALRKPKYVFYLIGDGLGASHRALAEYYQQYVTRKPNLQLAMNRLPVLSNVATHSLNSLVTDSAAAGTALATGHKTHSFMISTDVTGQVEYKTLLEAAKEKGMATGLITSVTITHATPATFAAHTMDRADEAGIASQYFARDIDYLAGGGLKYFLPKARGGSRKDDLDLTKEFEKKGYKVLTSISDFENTDFSKEDRVLGLYADGFFADEIDQMNAAERQTPELYQLLSAGIEVLSQNENGFFVMCEGGKIDEASHNNDTASVIQEVLAFDKAVEVAVRFYEKHPNETLIVVGADHETGGLSLSNNTYSLNFEPITKIKSSVAPVISAFQKDPKSIYKGVEDAWHIKLSSEEKATIDRRNLETLEMSMDALRSVFPPGTPDSMIEPYVGGYMFGYTGWAISPILSYYTRINWGSQSHTAETVPFTAIGVNADWLGGYQDNTDIARIMAKIMDVQLDD
ncbi:MAG TPA: hypothetical protein GXX75_10990 [Clostridiales bacterium]|nr:hypothetical protein [Clostridiales bacterium]